MNRLIKISPSKLETWRKYQDGEYNGFITKEKVIESITGKVEWSPAATFGSAMGLVMQFGAAKYLNPDDGLYHIRDSEMPSEVVLTYKEIYLADDFHKRHPAMVWEAPAKLKINVDGNDVLFSMRMDGLEGLKIHENKTSSKDMDVDFFEASYQWKLYFLATGAQELQYNIFSYDEPNTKRSHYEVYYDYIHFYPHGGLLDEVKNGVRHLIDFCKVNGIEEYLYGKPKMDVDAGI